LKPTNRHYFHSSCIKEWLTQNSTCPICSAFISKDLIKLNPYDENKIEEYFERYYTPQEIKENK
jgi:hypothetical protein